MNDDLKQTRMRDRMNGASHAFPEQAQAPAPAVQSQIDPQLLAAQQQLMAMYHPPKLPDLAVISSLLQQILTSTAAIGAHTGQFAQLEGQYFSDEIHLRFVIED